MERLDMSDTGQEIKPRKYSDAEGNTYAVERSLKTGKWIVVRVNAGGHRKLAKQFPATGTRHASQRLLDQQAFLNGWKEAVAL